jgi:putative two-component system response regulator
MERQTGRTRPQILVVDDEEFNRDLIAAVLGEEYDLLIAGSGQEALDAAVRHLPDLILLDVMMPRMDGFDVCWRLKADAMTRNIVVVFISAIKDRGFETIGRELGAVDFITKPIMPASMRDRIQSQLQVKLIPAQVTQVAEMEETLQLEVLEALNVQNKDGKIH